MNTIYLQKSKKAWTIFMTFFMALFIANENYAQTNPGLHNLGASDYTFTSWDAASTAGTYPPNMRFWRHSTNDPAVTATFNADYTGAYNGTSGTRMNGLGSDGFSFVNTGTSGNLGGAVLGLNTTGRENISVEWTGGTVAANPRQYVIRLQYRIGASGAWTDVPGPIQYASAAAANSQTFGPTVLPAALNNQPEIYLLWRYAYVGPTTGARPQMRVGNITVSSTAVGGPPPAIITPSTFNITAPSYNFGGSPSSTSFTINGSDLTGNPTITAPANFQVSLDNITFSSSVNVPVTGGIFSPNPRTIHVSLANSLTSFNYSGILTITGGGIASPIDININGEVTGSNIIAAWDFEGTSLANPSSPTPSIGNGSALFAGATVSTGGGVDPAANPCVWTNFGSAWAFSSVPPATSEFTFFTSTVNFSNIVLTYDMRFSNTATRSVQVQYTTNGGSSWTNFPLSALNIHRFCNTRAGIDGTKIDVSNPVGNPAGDARVRVSLNFSAIPSVNNISGFGVRFLPATFQSTGIFRQANTPASEATGGTWRFDNLNFQGQCAAPKVVSTVSSFSNFSYLEGSGPSAPQTTEVNGSCLTGNISITAPANFEVSLNATTGYASTLNLVPTSGVVATTTIYIRLIAGLTAAASPYAGTLSITSPSVTPINANLAGIVNSTPGVGNIVVARGNVASSNNTTFSLLEVLPGAANQATPVNIFDIDGDGPTNPTRFSASATSTGYLTNSNDRSLLLLTGHASNLATGNANAIQARRVISFNANGALNYPTTYTGSSGQQTRSATTINNSTFFIGDQNGMYSNGTSTASPAANARGAKAFGGIVYVQTTAGPINTLNLPVGGTLTPINFAIAPVATALQDFYLVSSGFNGTQFDILYLLYATSPTAGTIHKYSLVSGTWVGNGTVATTYGGFGLSAVKSGIGADLYITTGTGATAANILKRVVDVNGYNQSISLASEINLYTTAAGTTLKGVAFAPVANNAPNITTTSTLLDNFNYVALPGPGGPSASQFFNVSATNLTDDVTITAGTGFEISLDNITYSNSIVLPRSGTTLLGQPVQIRTRMVTGLTPGTYTNVLTLTTTNGLTKFVNVRGVVDDVTPTVNVVGPLLNFTTYRNEASAIQTYTVNGFFLDANISVAIPAGYEHRIVGNPTFQTVPITLTQNLGTVNPTTIEVRLASGVIAIRNGNITFTSINSNNPTIAITGEVMPRVVISEIHYNPNDAGGFTDANYEFLEFRNLENIAVNISGYFIFGVETTVPASTTIPANARIVFAKNPATYPGSIFFSGDLNNSGETIRLQTTVGNTVNQVSYLPGGGWPTGANGGGPSLELLNIAGMDNNNPSNWCAIGPDNGTPGASNTCGIIYYSTNPGTITDAIWAIDPSTPPLVTFPGFNEFSDIVVRHLVELNPSASQTIRNLTIGTSGRLWRNESVNVDTTEGPSNLMRYIDVFGNTITVNGVLGNPNTSTNDLLGINLRGGNYTITGNGTINIGRIRKQFQSNTTTLNINANMRLGFNGTVIYNNHSGSSSRFDVIVNAGRTVNVTHPQGGLAIDGTQGTASGDRSGSFTINGTVNVPYFWHRENRGFVGTGANSTGVQTTIGPNGRLNVKELFMQTQRQGSTSVNTPLNITPGGRLTITENGTLLLFGGSWNANGGLFVSDGASVMHGTLTPGVVNPSGDALASEITGIATVRRTGGNNQIKYNYWSSPVTGATLGAVVGTAFNPTNSILNLYEYNPSIPTVGTAEGFLAGWVNVPPSTEMLAAKGYITTGASTVSFSGPLNNGDINRILLGGSVIRMNLIGNPYPSGISAADFLALNGTLGNNRIENTLYFWTDDGTQGGDYANDDYVAFNGTITVNGVASKRTQFNDNGRVINAAQGFVVAATPAGVGQNIQFNNTMRRSAANNPFFSVDEISKIHLSLKNQNNIESEMAIAFREDLTDEVDMHFDSKKLFGNANVAIYSMVNETPLMIDGYGELTNSRIIDLGVTAKHSGSHTLEISQIQNIDPSVLIFIENISTGDFHNLRNAPFIFNGGANVNGVLYRLHFREPINVAHANVNCDQTGGSITINTPFEGWDYEVKNTDGQIVYQASNPLGENTIQNLDAGNYTISMTYSDGYNFESYVEIEATTPVNGNISVSSNEVSLADAIVEVLVNAENSTFMSVDMGDGVIYHGLNYVHHAYNQVGTYLVTVTINNATCTETFTSTIKVNDVNTTGIANIENGQVALFPNPAKESVNVFVNVPANAGNLLLNVTDVQGRIVINRQFATQAGIYNETLDTRNLEAGVYQVNIIGKDFNAVKKLVIQK